MYVNLLDHVSVSISRWEEVKAATSQGAQKQELRTAIKEGWPEKKQDLQVSLRLFWSYREDLHEHDGVILRASQTFILRNLRKKNP